MKLATIEIISDVTPHWNADSLDIVKVLGYQLVTQKGLHEKGKKIIYVRPDTVLPLDQKWSEGYLQYAPTRVKAIKLRKEWSEGIIVTFEQLNESSEGMGDYVKEANIGDDIASIIGVTKYEPPLPQDENADGYLPHDIPATDEERWENLVGSDELPFGEKVDIFLKVDGTSMTVTSVFSEDGDQFNEVCGRRLKYKADCNNTYIQVAKSLNLFDKLNEYIYEYEEPNLAIRGELYGEGIQSFSKNPHSKLKKGFALFSVYNIDKRCYERKGSDLYFLNLSRVIDIPTVPLLHEDVILTQELIDYYSTGINQINGQPFEGVVVQHSKGSFKIINKEYDSKK